MFPVEYVYGDWIGWQTNSEAQLEDPESLTSPSERSKVAGSRAEGFCIPQFILRKRDIDSADAFDVKEHWQPDLDVMTEYDSFIENDEKKLIPIFSIEHTDDPRYAKLRLTTEWKDHRQHFKNVSYLHHTFLLPSAGHHMEGHERKSFDGQTVKWSYRLHGPVRTLQSGGYPSYEEDQTGVFKYPIAWPEPAMEWLIRSHPSGWPSSDLVQEIFDSGCHLAPVGRGKRLNEPVDIANYCQNPEVTVTSSTELPVESNEGTDWVMDGTEWKISFAVAENKLGESVSPVQRHIMVLLKMIKKFYFPGVISTYHLKHLLFWECENKDECFWKEDHSASCLLFMLDRLQKCLEAHHLPHYILPESNLLKYEDPSKLNEAAVIVAEVRRNILARTLRLLRRLQSLTYQSQTYLQSIGLQLEDHLMRIQDRNLTEEDHYELLRALYIVFVGKCKDVIGRLRRIQPSQRKDIGKLTNVALYVYQSILGRNLCKLWFLGSENDESNDYRVDEEEFKSFVKEKVDDLSSDEDFLAVALVFFEHTRKGLEPSLAIPSTSVMGRLRKEHMKIAQENVEHVRASLKGVFDWLKRSDLKTIEEKATKKLQGLKDDGTVVSREEIERLINEELTALFQERMKDKT